MRENNWNEAKEHLYYIKSAYEEIGWTGTFAIALTINPLIERFEAGERTNDLYDKIMELE